MKAKELLIVSIFAVLFIGLVFSSGCIKKGQEEAVVAPAAAIWQGGTQGVAMSFYSNMPPAQVYEPVQFNIGLLLENKGEYVVESGAARVYIEGINPDIYCLNTTNMTEDCGLPGVKNCLKNTENLSAIKKISDIEVIPGGQQLLIFDDDDLHYTVDIPSGSIESTILARLCYTYHTDAVAAACLKQQIFTQTTGTQACEISGDKRVQNSGGPVQVTRVTEIPMGSQRVGFQIEIANQGAGEVFNKSEVNNCTELMYGDMNIVNISWSISGIPTDKNIECTTCQGPNKNYVTLVNGRNTFMLTVKTDAAPAGAYIESLDLDFDYGYRQQITQSPKMIAIPEVGPKYTSATCPTS